MIVPTAYRYHLLASGKSAGTIKERLGDVERFARHCPDVFAVTTEDLVHYLGIGADILQWRPEYLKKIRASFRSFYHWAHATGRIQKDPAYGLTPVTVPRPLPHPTPDVVVLHAFVWGITGDTGDDSARGDSACLAGRYTSLRHRAATVGYSGTKDLRATQELLGHASPATTQIYTAVAFADMQAVVTAASLEESLLACATHHQ
jgi:site-specific recombinase XerD